MLPSGAVPWGRLIECENRSRGRTWWMDHRRWIMLTHVQRKRLGSLCTITDRCRYVTRLHRAERRLDPTASAHPRPPAPRSTGPLLFCRMHGTARHVWSEPGVREYDCVHGCPVAGRIMMTCRPRSLACESTDSRTAMRRALDANAQHRSQESRTGPPGQRRAAQYLHTPRGSDLQVGSRATIDAKSCHTESELRCRGLCANAG